ncbi:hypothetical protein NQ317_008474 [Molorchus minor]|uniref:Uncharacterized protein n=1 Tax=Molorchus minor TaxID=1323400 RepID=A0ABQ9JCU9_9CUCU|nr:hypothetical protein NQ317_008474 [Molorchus minor]
MSKTVNGYIEDYLNILSEKGFISLINKVTRPELGTCLDHIFVRSKKFDYHTLRSAVIQIQREMFIGILKKCINEEIYKEGSPCRKKKPWITKGLITSMKKRDKLFQDSTKNPLRQDIRETYIKYRNKCRSFIVNKHYDYHIIIIIINSQITAPFTDAMVVSRFSCVKGVRTVVSSTAIFQ